LGERRITAVPGGTDVPREPVRCTRRCAGTARTCRTKENAVQILGLIVVGLIIGALARLIKPGRQRMSVFATLALGVVGAIIGGLIGHLFNKNTGIFELNVVGFIIAVIAAVLLIGVAEGMSGRNNRAVR
jgi:uncharacterized membrane protein YeaQ/YmgE (transglycosylase-associated protein family)